MASRTLPLPIDGDLHKRLMTRLRSRIQFAEQKQQEQHDRWTKAEEITLAYVPETEADAVRRNARDNGEPRYTTIQLPYTFALLLSAHTYWTSVFFSRSPVHQYAGRHGETEQQIQALEALINYQVDVGGMLGPYYIWLYDMGKYGVGILGEYWDVETISYGQIVEMQDPMTGQVRLMQATQELEGYRGNRVYNVSPYDFLPDPRVPVGRFQDGEFCARRVRLLWHDIERRKTQGYITNTEHLALHLSDKGHTVGSSQLDRPQFDTRILEDVAEDGKVVKHKAAGVFWEVYVKVCPAEWGLGKTTNPQIWCFTITEDLALVVGASPLGLMHGKFPFTVGENEIEGYGVYGRGMPEIMAPVQNTMDWLINSHFYNVRAALNNQFIIDPSKIVVKDATNVGPGFIWRLRPEAYGTDITKMFHQVPVQDMTRTHLADIQTMIQFGERALGINDQIMGMLGGTNRKTATEVRTSTGFGVNRQKTTTEYTSAVAFGPHSMRLVQNSQQLFTGQQKFRIAGSLMQEAGMAFADANPQAIAGFYDFVPIDGTLPIDRMAQANLWKEILIGVQRMPQVAMQYDIGRIFAWMATIAGLKNINQFKIQVVPDQQAALAAAAGNVIPLRPGDGGARMPQGAVTPGASASTDAGLDSLGGEGGAQMAY